MPVRFKGGEQLPSACLGPSCSVLSLLQRVGEGIPVLPLPLPSFIPELTLAYKGKKIKHLCPTRQQVFGTQPTFWFLHNRAASLLKRTDHHFSFSGMGFPPLQLVLMSLFPCVPWLPQSRQRFTSVSPGSLAQWFHFRKPG